VPDLAIEIVSPTGEIHDKQVKRTEYAQAGIPEYWIVDPEEQSVTRLNLNAEGTYADAEPIKAPAALTSAILPGFTLSLAHLFAPE
jgi:Uma2 family endonuclease